MNENNDRTLPDAEAIEREIQGVLDNDYLMRQTDRTAWMLALRILTLFSDQPTAADVWDEGYAKGNLDGYWGSRDEKNPYRIASGGQG